MSFFRSSIEIIELSNGMPSEHDLRTCEPGDTFLFEEDGVAFTLLEVLMMDRTHATWRALITAHPNEERLGAEEWFGINLNEPLPSDRILIRGR